ncbi:MAG: Abi family protein [Muribaculaceae bacterium]|nr:Abi family protein [Muribaculaceae bacterium]
MKYSEYEIAFSTARLNRYLVACGGNRPKALSLYRHNVKLCQKFYGMLNIFEVVLRNAINLHYQQHFSDTDWIRHQCEPGGILESAPQRAEIERTVAMLERQGKYSNDRLVSSVTFGFWTYLFNRIPFRNGGMNLLQIFPNRTPGLAQRPIYNELQDIKSFRNRIAHHEAICFNSAGDVDLGYAQEKLDLIKKYVIFLGYNPLELFWGTGIRPYSLFDRINNI